MFQLKIDTSYLNDENFLYHLKCLFRMGDVAGNPELSLHQKRRMDLALSYTGSALRTDLSIFALCIMGFSRFWLTVADKEIKVHRRVIRMIIPMIQRSKNDRSVRRVLPVYDNAGLGVCNGLY